MPGRDRLDNLAQLIRVERVRKYGHVVAAERSVGMSRGPWARAESGKPVESVTYGKIEAALGWEPGSIHAYLEAGGPEPGAHRAPRGAESTAGDLEVDAVMSFRSISERDKRVMVTLLRAFRA